MSQNILNITLKLYFQKKCLSYLFNNLKICLDSVNTWGGWVLTGESTGDVFFSFRGLWGGDIVLEDFNLGIFGTGGGDEGTGDFIFLTDGGVGDFSPLDATAIAGGGEDVGGGAASSVDTPPLVLGLWPDARLLWTLAGCPCCKCNSG